MSFWFGDEDVMEMLINPMVIIYQNDDKTITTQIHHGLDDRYEGYGLIVCDLVRHIARAFDVTEEEVWNWVDRERHHHTTEIREPS